MQTNPSAQFTASRAFSPQSAVTQSATTQPAVTQPATAESATTQPIAPPNSSLPPDIYLSALIVSLPICVGLGIIFHKKRRATLMRQRIETLERIWRLNYRKTRS
ncbi:MAG: hypothetical protein HY785_23625 [Oscillatoriophycideae cyanobacterium NC_groundwater_1537_Pr4_S-0.65um_50_18]|nr:hypothetical protein [Oscillatoriophycideae cyanobacterium NC_groundwater_1537_Pr4_S-0.65um_50_18]